jgi:hypothetical protein
MVHLLCGQMKEIVKLLPKDEGAEKSNMRVGFITYSNTVHFYNIKVRNIISEYTVFSSVCKHNFKIHWHCCTFQLLWGSPLQSCFYFHSIVLFSLISFHTITCFIVDVLLHFREIMKLCWKFKPIAYWCYTSYVQWPCCECIVTFVLFWGRNFQFVTILMSVCFNLLLLHWMPLHSSLLAFINLRLTVCTFSPYASAVCHF